MNLLKGFDLELIKNHLKCSSFLFFLTVFITFSAAEVYPGLPDTFDTNQKIEYDGYPSETHFVTTDDGYILRCFRIPNEGKKIAYLQHGLEQSTDVWVWNAKKDCLPYQLHNDGYDVWMCNSRGNYYSTNHTSLNPNSTATLLSGFTPYWSFSFHEVGVYDLPNTIDFILNLTGKTQITYIGHSQGTTVFYAMLSEKPAYNDKITKALLLAPVAYVGNMFSPVFRALAAAAGNGLISDLITLVGPGQFTARGSILNTILNATCTYLKPVPLPSICSTYFFALYGFDYQQFNNSLLPVYMAASPAGFSTQGMLHYAQLINSKKFQRYDYGVFNIIYYGLFYALSPPTYNLANVKVPISLYYGCNDWLSDPKDVKRTLDALTPNYIANPNNLQVRNVNWQCWNHLDFICAIDSNVLLFNSIRAELGNTNFTVIPSNYVNCPPQVDSLLNTCNPL